MDVLQFVIMLTTPIEIIKLGQKCRTVDAFCLSRATIAVTVRVGYVAQMNLTVTIFFYYLQLNNCLNVPCKWLKVNIV